MNHTPWRTFGAHESIAEETAAFLEGKGGYHAVPIKGMRHLLPPNLKLAGSILEEGPLQFLGDCACV